MSRAALDSPVRVTARLDPEIALAIGEEGYTFLYPLVLMDVTRRQMTNVAHTGEAPGRGPADAFTHVRAFPPGDFKDVVRANFDTLYSVAWVPLHEEPRVISLPAAGDNYYLLPMYDMWTDIFACPGTRTTGGVARDYALCGPGWDGELPEGLERIDAPTPWVWFIGRTKASPATYEAVHAFQDGMRITPLSVWPERAREPVGSPNPKIDAKTPPLRQVFAMNAAEFFAAAAKLVKEHPPHVNDGPVLQRLARVGFHPGASFDLTNATPQVRAALEAAVPAAQKRITEFQTRLGVEVSHWRLLTENMGTWGTNYLRRACIDLIGLGANLPEDAVYPLVYLDADGEPFTGAHDYLLHFEKDQIPPARAFWSLTLYDAEGFQVPNELDRFAIGDRDALALNDDGSLDLQIQHTRPDSGTSNWLPAPDGGFNLALRIYLPATEALDGRWVPPAVTKAVTAG
jgi:hypothetical protein